MMRAWGVGDGDTAMVVVVVVVVLVKMKEVLLLVVTEVVEMVDMVVQGTSKLHNTPPPCQGSRAKPVLIQECTFKT
jgi:hypothetical protein